METPPQKLNHTAPTTKLRVAIVEDQRDLRETLVDFFDAHPNMSCVASYGSAEEALQKIAPARPDVLILDINLPGMTGTAAISLFLAQLPSLKVLMHTVHDDSDQLFACIRAGATGYLLKSTRPDKLLEATLEAASGGSPLSPALARRMVEFFRTQPAPSNPLDALTSREREILEQLAKGQLYKEISSDLGLSYSTVRTHIEHIYQKLRVNTKAAAIAQFKEHKG